MCAVSDINRDFQTACALKDQAISSLANVDDYLAAAEAFERAASLALTASASSPADPDMARQLGCFGRYYEAERFECLASYEYEQRRTVPAHAYAEQSITSLMRAIELASGDGITRELAQRLASHADDWGFKLLLLRAKLASIDGRGYWDSRHFIKALDCYNEALSFLRRARDYALSGNIDQRRLRIVQGNVIALAANVEQARAAQMLASGQSTEGTKAITLPTDLVIRYIRFELNAYELGSEAYDANPEWEQYREMATQTRRNVEGLLRTNTQAWLPLYIEFSDDQRLLRLMQLVDLKRFRRIVAMTEVRESKAAKLWAVGSFWLLVFVVVAAAFTILANQGRGFWLTLLIVTAIEVVITIIGAMVLRSVGDLSERGLLDLLSLALKTQLGFARLFREPSTPPASSAADEEEAEPRGQRARPQDRSVDEEASA